MRGQATTSGPQVLIPPPHSISTRRTHIAQATTLSRLPLQVNRLCGRVYEFVRWSRTGVPWSRSVRRHFIYACLSPIRPSGASVFRLP